MSHRTLADRDLHAEGTCQREDGTTRLLQTRLTSMGSVRPREHRRETSPQPLRWRSAATSSWGPLVHSAPPFVAHFVERRHRMPHLRGLDVDLPQRLDDAVARMLTCKPTDRFPSGPESARTSW